MILTKVLASLYAERMCTRLKQSQAEGFSKMREWAGRRGGAARGAGRRGGAGAAAGGAARRRQECLQPQSLEIRVKAQ